MFRKLIGLELKSFMRSASLGKDLAMKIFIWLFGLYMIGSMLLLGIGLYFILEKAFPDQAPIYYVNQFIVIWFIIELVMRYMMQKIPMLNIKPFLIQNIKRDTIVDFLLLKSVLSFFNFLTPVIVIPFVVSNFIKSDFTSLELIGWTIDILSLVLVANFLNILLQKKIIDNNKLLIPFLAVVTILVGLQYFDIFYTTKFVGNVLNYMLHHPYLCIIPLLLVVGLYIVCKKVITSNFYLDAYLKTDALSFNDNDFSWISKFGEVAPFMQLDLKLIWRNKRPKTAVYTALMFSLYGLIFYTNDMYSNSPMLAFVGIFMTGMFMINFGQFIPAWDSSYYPMMMTQNIPLKLYLKSKATLMYFSIIVMAILTTFYAYFGYHILILNLACAVYNIGINVPLILRIGANNKKRIDLDKSQFMNYQGTGVAQWLIMIPVMVFPVLIWLLFNYIFNFLTASLVLAGVGVIGFALKSYFFNLIEMAYKKNKYLSLQGFKQQNA